jgi:hypothetical protein
MHTSSFSGFRGVAAGHDPGGACWFGIQYHFYHDISISNVSVSKVPGIKTSCVRIGDANRRLLRHGVVMSDELIVA